MTNSRANKLAKMLTCGDHEELTLATGVITISGNTSFIRVLTEAAAATDDLVTISGGSLGDVIILEGESASRVVTCKDDSGNLKVEGGDFVLTNSIYKLTLIKSDTNWHTIAKGIP